GFNYSQSSNGTFNLVFHTAETNWPQDLEPAQFGDAVSTLDNIYDSIILRTSRVGHGIGLIKHPDLYKYLIDRQIAVEICPASNQILGYVSDLRNHPAINFFRSGIPIVIAGDDPGSFGYNDLTVDFYLAYMAWGLDLYDLKIIASNSIRYSLITNESKIIGFEKFNKLWDNFIDKTYENACLAKNNLTPVNVSNLLPSYGPVDKEVELSIFGLGFEKALCQNVSCLFNNVKTIGQMISINEIRCKTPVNYSIMGDKAEKVNVSLQFGDQVFSTPFTYTFVAYSIPLVDDEMTVTKVSWTVIQSNSQNKNNSVFMNILLTLSLVFVTSLF
ncbi:unnamed protein product, partial [Brachionus calyciflorus]